MDFLNPEHQKDQPKVYGNMWGWKFSFISLGIIVVLLLLAFYRYTSLQQPALFQDDQAIIHNDSLDQLKPDMR